MIHTLSEQLPFQNLAAFLKNGTKERLPSRADLHLLTGWKKSTLLRYNSAVSKFVKFHNQFYETEFKLPISSIDLEEFCVWAGRNAVSSNVGKISFSSLRKYIAGLKAWHVYHNYEFPSLNKSRIELLLKASAQEEELAEKPSLKQPIMLWHLAYLWKSLLHGDNFDKAVLDICIVAFWGLARLAELTYAKDTGDILFAHSVLTTDAVFTSSENLGDIVTLTIRNTKTAKLGVPQIISLCEQHHTLCPVLAIKRRLLSAEGLHTSLFGYSSDGVRRHVTRRQAAERIIEVLATGGYSGLRGHFFRVGGALFRTAMGMKHADLRSLGRWESNCYRRYLRSYSAEDMSKSKSLLRALRKNWKRMAL
jgi:hypothetical protein